MTIKNSKAQNKIKTKMTKNEQNYIWYFQKLEACNEVVNLYPTISAHETKQKNNPSTKRFTNFDNLMSEKELFNHK